MTTTQAAADCQDRAPGAATPAPAQAPGSLRFACPFCRLTLEVSPDLVGVRGPCPGCGEEIEAPPRFALALPEPVAVKPRPGSKERLKREEPGRPRGMSAPLPMTALGVLPPPPPAPAPNPPVPRQPPIPPQPTVDVDHSTLEARLEWGVSPQRRRRRRSCPGRSIDPTSPFSMRYRNRKELLVAIKVLLAVVATIAIAIAVAVFTKRSVLAPSGMAPACNAPKAPLHS